MNQPPFIFHDMQDSQMFALAQSAGRAGFKIHGITQSIKEAPWVKHSQFIDEVTELPSLGDVNKGIYALNLKKAGITGVFVPVVDDIADLLAEYAPLLRKNGLSFLTVSPNQIDMCNTIALQQWQGSLWIPPTAYCTGQDLLKTAIAIGFPIILKSIRDGFITFYNQQSLEIWLETAHTHYPLHLHQRVQRYIQGSTEKMATVLLLFDTQTRPVRGFTARRLRVAQTHYGPFGETLAAKAEWLPNLYHAAVELLTAIGWVGFAEVECKQDQNGQWHLLEINPRLSGWTCLAEADGAGLLQAYYHLNTTNSALEPVCLQRSQTSYSRMIASSGHQPDWENFQYSTYKKMFQHQTQACFGAWDKLDKQANQAWLKLMVKRFLKKV